MKNVLVVLILLLVAVGCERINTPPENASAPASGNVALTFDKANAPSAVKTITTVLSRSGYTAIEKTLDIFGDTSAVILFDKVAVGTWKISVDAKNESGQIIYSGQSDVVVLEGTVSMVNIVMSPVITGVGGVQINVTWGNTVTPKTTDFEFNAVLTKSDNVNENVGVSQPRIYKFNDKYYMYYQMIGKISAVGLAISFDGVSWTKYPNPILSADNNLWDAGGTVTGPILRIDSNYVMYYQAYSPYEGVHFIGIANSIDGIVWKKPSNNRVSVDGKYINIIHDIVRMNGKYLLYYSDIESETGNRAIYCAVSEDAITWRKYQSAPILKKTFAWEIGGVYYLTIVYENGKYTATYADAGVMTSNFGLATSTDGINWTKQSTPVFTKQFTYKNWASAGISYPALVKIGSQYRIYYMGAVGSNYERRIGFAYLQ